jgi:hypothetical protein
MNKIMKLLLFSCVFALVLSACITVQITNEAEPSTNVPDIVDTATPEPVEETEDLPSEPAATVEEEPEDEITAEPVVEADVDMGNGFYLTYDSNLWHVDDSKGYNVLELNGDSKCRILYQFGHGMDPNRHGVESFNQVIGNTDFQISRWYILATGETIVYGFTSGSIYVSVENSNAEPLSDYCVEQAEQVMWLSEANGF